MLNLLGGPWVISVQKCRNDAVGHSIISWKVNWLQVQMLPNDILKMLAPLRLCCLDLDTTSRSLLLCVEMKSPLCPLPILFCSLGPWKVNERYLTSSGVRILPTFTVSYGWAFEKLETHVTTVASNDMYHSAFHKIKKFQPLNGSLAFDSLWECIFLSPLPTWDDRESFRHD